MPSAGEIAKSVMCGNGGFCAECLLADLAVPGWKSMISSAIHFPNLRSEGDNSYGFPVSCMG